ncbi:hypothetical protein HYH03_015542 [Edaphochlamys debaryana]|uniref:FAD-binding FR-type domain-containing protein n=1 Tax=Edaphochlamys debaryana TaxID=47281 RepID=A0A835XKE7_9CHLO|nr:hypothetical protein HYH03_015542 [Edaphochlamys debaryana]|eukprot:KAG2485733.1 hypothetical protein HYH03_015542 [Edaphochlamys debaryana]
MASAWPLLGNLAVLLLPMDRALMIMSSLGAGHEDGVLAHALCGTAVWVWAAMHAILVQSAMLAAGLWSIIVLPPADGSESKSLTNFMGLLAFMCVCVLGVSSLARLRRRAFNVFQWLHITLAPLVLAFACLHDHKVFRFALLGAVLYGSDVAARLVLRRRRATATATVYPCISPGHAGVALSDSCSSRHVVLRIHTGAPPGCFPGQHVWIKVPSVSGWEWHPYSVAAYDGSSFALVIKATGDWERRLCKAVEQASALTAAGGGELAGVPLDVCYEGLYGTSDLQAAVASSDHIQLFAGGSGITPLASIIEAMLLISPAPADATPPSKRPSAAGAANGHGPLSAPAVAPAPVGAAQEMPAHMGPRVQLIWAVTQETDTKPLMPLLSAAAARGWQIDIHCTRQQPGEHPHSLQLTHTSHASQVYSADHHTHAHSHSHAHGRPAHAALHVTARSGAPVGSAEAAPAKPPCPPWRLHGGAGWAVAALAAGVGAVGCALGTLASSTHTCTVSASAKTSSGDKEGVVGWTRSVRAAFTAHAAGAARTAAAAEEESGAGGWRRLAGAVLRGLGGGEVSSCPQELRVRGSPSVALRVCRAWGREDPILCVKCDPFKARSPLEAAWTCCPARECYYGPQLAPLIGWVLGAMLGAFLACYIWRAWSRRAAAAAVKRSVSTGGTGAGAAGAAKRWAPMLLVPRRPLEWVADLRRAAGGGGGRAGGAKPGSPEAEPLLPRSNSDAHGQGLAAAEEGAGRLAHGGEEGRAGLEPIVDALGLGAAGVPGSGLGGRGCGICVHFKRPDIEAYIRHAATGELGDDGGPGGIAGYGGAVVGVVVCGPEALTAEVTGWYMRVLAGDCPNAWFRGFSFTT